MRRRELLSMIIGAASWPLAARAQPAGERMRLVGVLMNSNFEKEWRVTAFEQGLQKLGWTAGRNIRLEWRWASADAKLEETFAKELVDMKCDVLVAQNTSATRALVSLTKTIPVVFLQVGDPVAQRFITTTSRPGGNATGFMNFEFSMGGKWLEVLKELAPDIKRIAMVANPNTTPYKPFLQSLESVAPSFNVKPTTVLATNPAEIEDKINAFAREPGGSLLVMADVFTSVHRELIVRLAAKHRLPAIYPYRLFTSIGGLIAYGINPSEVFARGPAYVDRILRGDEPAELPVQAPTKFEVSINLRTAKELGLTVPAGLQVTADEVFE